MGLDSRHVILTPPPLHFNTPSSGFCGFLLTLWNCQSSQWPGQALSLWRRGFKMVPTKQHGRRIWKRHNELEKKKILATWETKPGEGEKMLKKEKRAGGTLVILLYSPANSESSEWAAGISSLERSDREKGRDKKKKVRARPKEGGENKGGESGKGGWRGEQLESLSSAPSRWIGLMNASECWGAAAGSIKAGNTAQI